MKNERKKEIKELFRGYGFVEVTNTGWIKVSLYGLKYDTDGLSRLIKVLSIIEGLDDYDSCFDVDTVIGYYDAVEDVHFDFRPI